MKRWPRLSPALRIPSGLALGFRRSLSSVSNRGRNLAFLAVAVLLLACLGSWQVVHRGFGVGIPAKSPVMLGKVPMQTVIPRTFIADERNPFDASQMPWSGTSAQATASKPESAPAVGRPAGMIAIPGFSAVITEQGLVRPGQSFHGGRFKRIEGDSYILDAEGEEKRVPIPRASRPTLESLNRARPASQEKQ